jgi:hypothetical protein
VIPSQSIRCLDEFVVRCWGGGGGSETGKAKNLREIRIASPMSQNELGRDKAPFNVLFLCRFRFYILFK